MAKDKAAHKAPEETKAEPLQSAPHIYRADQGEGLPTPPLKTATDSE